MLKEIGVTEIEDLFTSIPQELRFKNLPAIEGPLSEQEVSKVFKNYADTCRCRANLSFLGAGVYQHYIPAVVDHIASRDEFTTAYTPYQPEISQGTLQAAYEFQSLICQLTGLDVANASLYDGSTAFAEACLMAVKVSRKKNKLLIAETIHPEYRQVLDTYLKDGDISYQLLPQASNGLIDLEQFKKLINEDIAAVVLQSPNFFGCIEDFSEVSKLCQEQGSLLVQLTNEAQALSMLKTPAANGVDIFCGEGQSFGLAPSFGGPHLGLFACRQKFLRSMPGRIAGKTVDENGKSAYCLTLSTREQHIRREKATSNICTNQALMALRSLIYLAALGGKGLAEVAQANFNAAHWLAEELAKIDGLKLRYSAPFFNEFTLELNKPAAEISHKLAAVNIVPGLALSRFNKEDKSGLLVCCSELHSKEDLLKFVGQMKEALK